LIIQFIAGTLQGGTEAPVLVKPIVHWKGRNGVTTSSLELGRRRSRLRSILIFQETRNLFATSRRGVGGRERGALEKRAYGRVRERPGRRDTAVSSRTPPARLCAGTRPSDRGFVRRRPLRASVVADRPIDSLRSILTRAQNDLHPLRTMLRSISKVRSQRGPRAGALGV
jgi:hypothetical protein